MTFPRPTLPYAATSAGLLVVAVGTMWPFFEGPGRFGIALAALVAWPVQVLAFGLLVAARKRLNGFLAVWAAGVLVRMALVVAAPFLLLDVEGIAPIPTLLALAGFLFALLLLEPLFLKRATPVRAREA